VEREAIWSAAGLRREEDAVEADGAPVVVIHVGVVLAGARRASAAKKEPTKCKRRSVGSMLSCESSPSL
jgi:hypothetical protein